MSSIEIPPEVAAALDALDAADAAVRGLNFDALSPVIRLRVLEHMETSRRRQVATSHDVIAGLGREDPADIGGPVHKVIGDWLRISYAEACRRVRAAGQLSPRVTLTSQELPPELPATARAWRDGALDGGHLRVIQAFVRGLPDAVPAETVGAAEEFLAQQAAGLRPDQLEKVAHQCALRINPDGRFSDADRARQRGFAWTGQRLDGMSVGKLVARRSCGPISTPGSRGSRPPACAIRMMKRPASKANPATRPRAATRAALRSAGTMRSTRWCAAGWAIRNWARTTDCRSPSSCRPRCRS